MLACCTRSFFADRYAKAWPLQSVCRPADRGVRRGRPSGSRVATAILGFGISFIPADAGHEDLSAREAPIGLDIFQPCESGVGIWIWIVAVRPSIERLWRQKWPIFVSSYVLFVTNVSRANSNDLRSPQCKSALTGHKASKLRRRYQDTTGFEVFAFAILWHVATQRESNWINEVQKHELNGYYHR